MPRDIWTVLKNMQTEVTGIASNTSGMTISVSGNVHAVVSGFVVINDRFVKIHYF